MFVLSGKVSIQSTVRFNSSICLVRVHFIKRSVHGPWCLSHPHVLVPFCYSHVPFPKWFLISVQPTATYVAITSSEPRGHAESVSSIHGDHNVCVAVTAMDRSGQTFADSTMKSNLLSTSDTLAALLITVTGALWGREPADRSLPSSVAINRNKCAIGKASITCMCGLRQNTVVSASWSLCPTAKSICHGVRTSYLHARVSLVTGTSRSFVPSLSLFLMSVSLSTVCLSPVCLSVCLALFLVLLSLCPFSFTTLKI